jgi:predicted RecA/RadA family phage recombinase
MSTIPIKIDGIGTRKDGSGGESANLANPVQIRRFYASEAITKGDLVALNFAATEPDNGYGNHILICDTGDALNAQGIGVAIEAISSGDLGRVQVQGICTFAKVDRSAVTDGDFLTSGSDAGLLDVYTTDAAFGSGGDALPVAVCVKRASDDTASSTVYLINPMNL